MPLGNYRTPGFNPYAELDPLSGTPVDPGVSGLPGNAPAQPEGRFKQILGGLLGPGKQYGGLLDPAMQKQLQQQTLLNIGANLLATSQNGQGLGANVGQSFLQAKQSQQASIDDQIKQMVLMSNIELAKQKAAKEDKGDLVAIMGDDGSPQYVRASDAVGKKPFNNATPASDPASLQEYSKYVAQETAAGRVPEDFLPFTEKLSRARVGAPFTQGQVAGAQVGFDRRDSGFTPLSTADMEREIARRLEEEKTKGSTLGKADAERTATFDGDLARIDDEIDRTDRLLKEFREGKYQTGPLAGRLPNVRTSAQDLAREQGKDVLQGISSATFGALSEGEREFLKTIGISETASEESNINLLEQRKKQLARTKERLTGRSPLTGDGAQAPSAKPSVAAKVRKYNPQTRKLE